MIYFISPVSPTVPKNSKVLIVNRCHADEKFRGAVDLKHENK